jgi:hypothetical protein
MTAERPAERRSRDRATLAQSTVTTMRVKVSRWSRLAQALAGGVVCTTGVAALYVPARKYLAGVDFGAPGWAFFGLGALMLLGGFGIAIGEPFWRQLGHAATAADRVWTSVRGKKEPAA